MRATIASSSLLLLLSPMARISSSNRPETGSVRLAAIASLFSDSIAGQAPLPCRTGCTGVLCQPGGTLAPRTPDPPRSEGA